MNKYAPLVVFILSAALANALTSAYGFVPVGFGLTATAGTYVAGVALVARDYVYETLGIRGVVVAVALGGLLSFLTASPFIALASLVAFTFSEAADTLVYKPLRLRSWRAAVVLSSLVGAIVDTWLFITIAFGVSALSLNVMLGQLAGKVLWVAVPVAIVGGALRAKKARAA